MHDPKGSVAKYFVRFFRGTLMSRVANNPVALPSGLEVKIAVMLSSMRAGRAFTLPVISRIKSLDIWRSTFAVLLVSRGDYKIRYQNL